MNLRRAARVALLALPTLAACAPADESGPRIGAEAPAYGAVDLAGDSVTLGDFRGRPVLLNFWATWCAPCRHETPFLQSLYEEHAGRDLVVLGASVDTRDARGQVDEFVAEYGVTYPILLDPQMRGSDLFRVLGLPATFLVDREGVLRWMRFGPVSEDDTDFMAALETVLE